MKRSRIFMGMAALGVAAFGAFAFSPTSTATNAFYMDPIEESCESITVPQNCETGGNNCKVPSGHPQAGDQLYDDRECSEPLRLQSGF